MQASRRVAALLVGAALTVSVAACGGSSGSGSKSSAPSAPSSAAELPPAPEPAVAPVPAVPPAGQVVVVNSPVEGVVVDGPTRTAVAAVRNRQLALLDADTGALRATVSVGGTARHLQLAQPGGPVLVPGEDTDLLVQIGLPRGQVVASTRVGRQPHDAAYDPASRRVVVADELAGSTTFVQDGRAVATLPGPVQPGGLAVADGRAGVVDVRGRTLFVYDMAAAKEIARVPAGDGPTHAVPLGGDRLLVADTRGNALLVYSLGGTPREIGRIPQPGSPYGLAVDLERGAVYVALSATNQVLRYRIAPGAGPDDPGLTGVGDPLPTVQQPNSIGVDPRDGRLFIGSSAAPGSVQIVAPPAG
jgi:YD repeat-containing protein